MQAQLNCLLSKIEPLEDNAMKTDTGAIGVLGGVGPYAGLDLMRKIFDQTEANCDQEHLSVIQYSLSEHIIDRTRFLLGETDENPGEAIGEIMVRMAKAGATVIGVPCNTAHSPRIMDVAVAMLHEASPQTRFVHMIDAVVAFIRESLPHARTIGVLSTKGTYATGLYQDALSAAGFVPLFPDEEARERVQQAISNTAYGIKAQSNPVTPEARGALLAEVEKLVEQGADAVILGCTEIPLALTEPDLRGVPLLDATKVLARALIIAFAPERLKKA